MLAHTSLLTGKTSPLRVHSTCSYTIHWSPKHQKYAFISFKIYRCLPHSTCYEVYVHEKSPIFHYLSLLSPHIYRRHYPTLNDALFATALSRRPSTFSLLPTFHTQLSITCHPKITFTFLFHLPLAQRSFSQIAFLPLEYCTIQVETSRLETSTIQSKPLEYAPMPNGMKASFLLSRFPWSSRKCSG